MPFDADLYRISVGNMDYPTKYDAMLTAFESALNPSWDGPWLTATNYALFQIVIEGGTNYVCIEVHTSGVFATDLSASKWEVYGQSPGIVDAATLEVIGLVNGAITITGTLNTTGAITAASSIYTDASLFVGNSLLTTDYKFYLSALNVTAPVMAWDDSDYQYYNRTSNIYAWVIAGTIKFNIEPDEINANVPLYINAFSVDRIQLTSFQQKNNGGVSTQVLIQDDRGFAGNQSGQTLDILVRSDSGTSTGRAIRIRDQATDYFSVVISSGYTLVHESLYVGDNLLTEKNNFGLVSWISPTRPAMLWSANDYQYYDRSADEHIWIIGSAVSLTLAADKVKIPSTIFMLERAAKESDVAGYGQIYIKNDTPNILVFVDDAGTEFELGAKPLRKSQVFTANGTWPRPDGVEAIEIVLVAAGGGGANRIANTEGIGGGGGGEVVHHSVEVTDDVTITIGAGGAGAGTGTAVAGSDGSDSTLTVGCTVTADAGQGGQIARGGHGGGDDTRSSGAIGTFFGGRGIAASIGGRGHSTPSRTGGGAGGDQNLGGTGYAGNGGSNGSFAGGGGGSFGHGGNGSNTGAGQDAPANSGAGGGASTLNGGGGDGGSGYCIIFWDQ